MVDRTCQRRTSSPSRPELQERQLCNSSTGSKVDAMLTLLYRTSCNEDWARGVTLALPTRSLQGSELRTLMGPSLFVNSPGGSTRVRSTCFSRPAVLIRSLPSSMGWCGQYDRTAWAHGTLTPCITGSRCQPLRLSCLLRILGMCFVKAPAGVLLGCLPPSSVYRAIAKVALASPMTRGHMPLKRADVLLVSADIASVSRLQAISFLSILHAFCQQRQAKPCTLRAQRQRWRRCLCCWRRRCL